MELRIGFVGYSKQKYDREKAAALLKTAVEDVRRIYELPDTTIIFVSGYTNLGIPGQVYELAEQLEFKTGGVACKRALDYMGYDCDEIHLIGKNWGDESQFFIDHCDVFIRIGGGAQSLRECEMAKAAGKRVFEYELEAL